MTNEKNRHLTKGVRDRCASARSLCAKLELHSDEVTAALERCFGPFFSGHELAVEVRRVTLLLIDSIRQLIAGLLDAERMVHELKVQCSDERQRKNEAVDSMHRLLTSFRRVRLWDRGPVVPPGTISRRPERLLIEAERIRPHLDSPQLLVWPKPLPGFRVAIWRLGADFDDAAAELETALVEYERSRACATEARADRDLAMENLDRYTTAVRGLWSAIRPRTSIEDQEAGDAPRQRQSRL